MDVLTQTRWHGGERGLAELEWLLDYELCLALRYQRNVSLVLVADPHRELNLGVLENIMRRSDEVFRLKVEEAAILMSETPKAGALKAVERFRLACLDQIDLRFAIASFPSDGQVMRILLNVAHQRLNRARGSHRGYVIHGE